MLSPDGRWVVFVRAVPGRKISTGAGDVDAEELWQVRADGQGTDPPRRAERSRRHAERRGQLPARAVFPRTAAWFTSSRRLTPPAAQSTSWDTTKGKERFLVAGSTVEVVRYGEYRDCLLVVQHRYFIGGGTYDWIWLFRPDGKEVGPVGEDAESFKDTYYPEEEKGRGKP